MSYRLDIGEASARYHFEVSAQHRLVSVCFYARVIKKTFLKKFLCSQSALNVLESCKY